MSTIESRIKVLISEKLGIDEGAIMDGARFIEDLGADSLDTVELVMALEEEFGVDIPDEDAEKLRTFADVRRYVAALQPA